MADTKEVKDLAAAIGQLASQLNDTSDRIVDSFSRSASKASDLNSALEQILVSSTDLPKSIKSSKDLMSLMNKDASFFKKMQGSILSIQKESVAKYFDKASKKLSQHVSLIKNQVEQARVLGTTMGELRDQEEEITGNLQKQLALMEKQQEAGGGLRDFIKSMAPNSKAAQFVNFLDVVEEKFEIFKKFSSSPKGLLTSALGVGAIAGVGGVSAALDLVTKAFSSLWDFIDKKVFPTNAKLNKEFGNMSSHMGDIRKQAVSTGVQFEMLGYNFDQGADAVRGLASSMKTVALGKDTLKAGLLLSEYVGLGAEKAGSLVLAFEKTGRSIKEVNGVMQDASKIAHEYGVPVNQIRRDLGENIDLLARFGTENATQMLRSAAKVRQYGLSIKDVNAAFGKTLDTFEATGDASAKLNAVFGTNINSFELMLETNPEKRLEMVRKSLDKQGVSWEKLNPFEKNVLTTTLQLNEEQAQLAFASEDTRKKLEKQMITKRRLAKVDEDWGKGLSNIKTTLLAWKPLLDNLLRSFGGFVMKLLGFKNSAEGFTDTAKTIESVMLNLSKYLDNIDPDPIINVRDTFMDFTANLRDFNDLLGNIGETWDTIFSPITASRAEDFMNKMVGGAILDDSQKADFMKKLNDPELMAMVRKKMSRAGYSNKKIEGEFAQLSRGMKGAPTNAQIEAEIAAETAANSAGGTVNLMENFGKRKNVAATHASAHPIAGGMSSPGSNTASHGDVRVEVMDVNMDGRKVGEAQVRISRR